MDDEAFNDKKRKSDDMMKGRKVVDILFGSTDWEIIRDQYNEITEKIMYIYVIAETASGHTLCDRMKARAKHSGGGNFSATYQFTLTVNFGRADLPQRWFVTDWEHKEDANPLSQFQ